MAPDLTAYVLLTLLLVITPGAATAVVLRSSVEGGRMAGLLTAGGIAGGNLAYATAAGLGLVATLASYPGALATIRAAGAAYLVWLGLLTSARVWRARTMARRRASQQPDPAGAEPCRAAARSWFREGLVANLLNPFVPVFYAGYVPQFVMPGPGVGRRFALLGAIHVGLAFSMHSAYALAMGRAAEGWMRPRTQLVVQAVTGFVLLALGAWMLFRAA